MHALAYRQFTGQAGAMRRAGAEWGLIFNIGAAVANCATVLNADRA